jgi:hypothetical protein
MHELHAKVEKEGHAIPAIPQPSQVEEAPMPRRAGQEQAPAPRRLTPGMPLEQLETTPAPRTLPDSIR